MKIRLRSLKIASDKSVVKSILSSKISYHKIHLWIRQKIKFASFRTRLLLKKIKFNKLRKS
jgi:hypothetical protein